MKFNHFYFPPEKLVTDSEKFRIRLGTYTHSLSFTIKLDNFGLGKKIQQEDGIIVPQYISTANTYVYDFEKLFREIKITDLLNILTTIYENVNDWKICQEFISFCNKCFQEEGLAYYANEKCEIRFKPDQEFERNRISTIQILENESFSAALTAFNESFKEFQKTPQKTKSALRYIFEANEILFKKLVKPEYDCSRLTAKNIDHVRDLLLKNSLMNSSDQTAKDVCEKLLDSFKDWVNGIHHYRHGQDVDTYDNPPIDLTILALSNGASYLRWLATLIKNKKEIK